MSRPTKACEYCGQVFEKPETETWERWRNRRRFCSRACYQDSRGPEGEELGVADGVARFRISGKVVLVSAEDADIVRAHLSGRRSWHVTVRDYVRRIVDSRQERYVLLHQEVMGDEEGREIDHVNRNKRDNRRTNLRFATRQQNSANRPGRPGSSRYKGVTWDRRCRKWQARIGVDGETKHLGRFQSEKDAALAYDAAAREAFGRYAYLNFAEDPESEVHAMRRMR